MDQVKQILRQAIRYRFWIAVGIATIVPIVAYFIGAGPVQAQTDKITKEIEGAKKEVEQYANGDLPNRQYPPLVKEKTDSLARDVIGSWTKLYNRQAPLLTWPERVQDRFRAWGRKWPENEDASRVQVAIIDYVTDYPPYVEEVYETFHPFDYKTGKGVVAAPPQDALLRPSQFKIERLPDLGKVWAAQERLWLQRTLLQAVAEVNKTAKSWDSAIVRQINVLEVGSPLAQDQRSLSKGEELEEAPGIFDPKNPPAEEEAPDPNSMGGNPMYSMMMGGGPRAGAAEKIYYLKPPTENTQYKTLTFQMAVLVEQDHIQNFLCGLENSPMAIQVLECSMAKPTAKVEKPEIGKNNQYAGYGGGMMDAYASMMSRMSGGGSIGYGGGSMRAYENIMRNYGGSRGMTGPGSSRPGGVDKRATSRKAEREKKEEEEKSAVKHTSSHDPYFNIVEVTVYGQARFYNPPPPPEPTPETTAAEPAEDTEKAKPEGDMPKAEGETTPPDDAKAKSDDMKKDEPDEPKTGEPADKKAETPQNKDEPAEAATKK